MKKKHTLYYYTSIFLLVFLFCTSINAQNDTIAKPVKDTIIVKEKYGLRFGVDTGKIIRSFLDDEYTGFEVVADYRINKKMYIAGELGNEEKNNTTEFLNTTTKGSYFKAGIDYNLYQNWLDMDNMVYAGFRIGASTFSHTISEFSIYNVEQYWEPHFSSTDKIELDGLTALWTEIIIGIKAELFNNLYMGLNAQLKVKLTETEPDNFQNIFIPGFNKTYDSTRIGVGYAYTLTYRIPIYKKDKKIKAIE